ncbi:MAG: DNA polymerase III subunit gamma/tau [Hyphomicrobiales bacterium]
MPNTEYKILARKYRPSSFAELIGQDSMVSTISNSIHSGRIHQAYLFTGIRGIGKTTTARILARTLNYTLDNKEYIPSIELDKIGLNCDAIIESRHPDVFEMDAASNTGIDHVREIINFAQTKPTMAKYKIFIIDEVHMLSKQAFNGLLKILEEPPEHVIFIFATTEIEKIPITILSRCQKFNLKRIDNTVMNDYLRKICDKELIKIDNDSINIICSASEGSMRDALSILDQATSLCDGNITSQMLSEMLNLNDINFIISLFGILIEGESTKITDKIKQIYENGFEPLPLARDLSKITHIASMIKLGISTQSDLLSSEQHTEIKSIINDIDISTLVHMWQILLKGNEEIKNSFDQNISLEMLLIKLCYSNQLPPIEDLVSKIENSMGDNKTENNDIKPETKKINEPAENIMQEFIIPESYEDMKSLLIENDMRLISEMDKLDVIEYKIGQIDLTSNDEINKDIISTLQSTLQNLTNIKWDINFIGKTSQMDEESLTIENIKKHFPDAEIVNEEDNI